MKNRPVKHKSSNNFHFKSFRDRIKEVDIRRSALYRLETSEDRLSEQSDTFFYAALKTWSVLNLTNEYAEYQRLFKDSNTLSLLLFNKDDIIAHLLNCLQKTSDAAVQPLLELVVAVAKDLRKEFYNYFASVFNVLVPFLHSSSADRVEWTLICLAHLIKALRGFLRNDFTNTFDLLVPLLNEADSVHHAVNFATECLGYLARDLKDKRTLIDMLLKFQMQNDARTSVCGHVLFEILNGVQNQFHTTAKQTMQHYFDILQQLNQDDSDHLQEILTQTITDIVEYIHPGDIIIFWDTVRNTIEHCINLLSIQQMEITNTSADPNVIRYLTRILQLTGIVLEYKDGKLLGNSAPTAVSQLIRLLAFLPSTCEEFSETIVSHIIILLRSKNIQLSHLEASRLTRNMLMLDQRSLYERFVSSTVHCSAFETLIWPCFVKKLDDDFDDARLLFLTDLLLQKVPQSVNGLQLSKWKPYPVQVMSNGKVQLYIDSMLAANVLKVENVLQQFDLYLSALIVLPHLKCFIANAEFANNLSKFVLTLAHVAEAARTNVPENKKLAKIVQLIAVIVETIVHLNKHEKRSIFCVLESLLGIITLNNCLLLNTVHLLVVFIMDRWQCMATYQQFKRLHNCLSPLLSSFDGSIRHLSADILAKFDHLPELSIGLGPLYKTIARIESIESLVHTYREQVLLFQDLAYNSQFFKKSSIAGQSEEWTEITLHYMMSIYSVNFKLLWEPASSIIRNYVDNMKKNEYELFWRVFEAMLTMAERNIPYERPWQGYSSEMENLKDPDDTSNIILARVMPFLIKKKNIDYSNVRIQLLNMLRSCTVICRTHGDRIVDSFFSFLNSNSVEKDGNEDTTNMVVESKRHKSSPHRQQILLCYLNMCSELNKELLQEKIDQLYTVYTNFISSRNEELQQAALNGIFAYGKSHLKRYKDFISRLTNDKTLNNALLSAFEPSDEEMTANSIHVQITEQHRPDVVQLILNVLDGKIVHNLSCRDDAHSGQHKSAILTFIGRLRETELEWLLQRWFEPYLKLLKSTPLETVQCLMREKRCNTSYEIPTTNSYKINTLLSLLATLQTEAGLLPGAKFSIRLMHLKIAFDALVIQMDHTMYKKYKSRALLDLVDLIDHYGQQYQWTKEEIEAILHVHVWPNLENLPKDSIHSATPLLKLLFSCSRVERLYTVLEQPLCEFRPGAEKSFTPLSAMIALLNGSKTSSKVCQDIFTALAMMLDAEDKLCKEYVTAADKSTGRKRLLQPYVKDLLQFIRSSLRQKRTISLNLLVILQNLVDSNLIGSDENGERVEDDRNLLLSLLFPILIKSVSSMHDEPAKTQHETREYIRRLHIIVMGLLVQITEPERYIKQLAYMLEMVKDFGSRKMLFDIFDALATSNSQELQFIANGVRQMNAMDNRWIDQPDHSTRTSAFHAIDGLLIGSSDDLQPITGRICIVYLSQACHVLRFEKELSARQIAFDNVCKILEYLCADAGHDISPSDRHYCIEKIVLKSVLDGLKIRRFDDIRNDAILLLGELSRKLGRISMHQECRVFRELWHFTSQAPGMGKEMDFFDNITHLQTHQHCKALKRFAKKLSFLNENDDTSSKLSPRTVIQFLLPIVSHYVCNENYRTQTSIIDEATYSIVQMCRMLPWRSYRAVLLQYLRRLKYCWDYQKQLLKIVIGIMDAFHFNLSELGTDSHGTSLAIPNALMNRKLEMNTDLTGHNLISIVTNAVHLDETDELPKDVNNEEVHVENDIVLHQQENDLFKTSTEIVDDITQNVVPNLLSSFNFATEYLQSINGGKIGKFQLDKKARFAKQKEEILKLPIAMAIVKLFMKLPPEQIEINLPKLIIKVITFLKSRLKSVRAQARNTLAHITIELGPMYFSFILQNLLAMLTRGFQRHVLTFTVHTLIERAQKHLANENVMHDILQTVLHICMEDIFGQLIGIVRGTTIESGTLKRASAPESKSSRKPYQTLLILAQYAREDMLIDLFTPFCGVLLHYRTYQTVKKIQDAFRRIAIGIISNETIQAESLLVFIYGMLSGDIFAQCIASSSNDSNHLNILATKTSEKSGQLPVGIHETGTTYLIPSEPKRYGSTLINLEDCSGDERNDNVFLECGMQLLLNLIKRKHAEARHDREQGHTFKQSMNPIIPILVQSLDSKDTKIICLSLNCLSALWSAQWLISHMEERTTIESIVQSIFAILHRYNTVAIDVNASNFSIVRASFKAIVALLKYFKGSYRFTDEQLRLLILYIEQDISVGGGRQKMAFVLVRALIARRENFPELHCLMEKIFEICIRSESASERSECRQIAVEYIMCYPVGKKVQTHLLFLTDQLQYVMPTGRQSAGQLLKELFQRLPKEAIENQHIVLFFALGVRLSNESDKDNRALVAECIEKLLERLPVKRKSNLVLILHKMLADHLNKHRELAGQLLLRILRSEPTHSFINSWLPAAYPLLLANLMPQIDSNRTTDNVEPGKFVKPVVTPFTTLLNADTSGDHLIIQTLHVFDELLRLDSALLTEKLYWDMVDSLAYVSQALLASGHHWVRLGALRLLYRIINSLDFNAIHEKIQAEVEGLETNHVTSLEHTSTTHIAPGRQFFYHAPLRDCKSLTLDLCAQLTPSSALFDSHEDETVQFITQILFLVANILRFVPLKAANKINLYWLIRRVRYVIQTEIVKSPKCYTLRKHALHWMTSIVSIIEQNTLEQLAPSLLLPAVRELSILKNRATEPTDQQDVVAKSAVNKVALKLCKEIRIRLGCATYDKIRSALEQSVMAKRIKRKVQIAREKINQPLRAARRKASKNIRYKDAKKRKLQNQSSTDTVNDNNSQSISSAGKKRPSKYSAKRTSGSKKRRNMETLFKSC